MNFVAVGFGKKKKAQRMRENIPLVWYVYRSEKQASLPNFRNNAIGIKGLNILM